MKIAHIVCVFPPYKGGIGKSALDFAEMMSEHGHQVSVYTPVYTNVYALSEETEYKNIEVKMIKDTI